MPILHQKTRWRQTAQLEKGSYELTNWNQATQTIIENLKKKLGKESETLKAELDQKESALAVSQKWGWKTFITSAQKKIIEDEIKLKEDKINGLGFILDAIEKLSENSEHTAISAIVDNAKRKYPNLMSGVFSNRVCSALLEVDMEYRSNFNLSR